MRAGTTRGQGTAATRKLEPLRHQQQRGVGDGAGRTRQKKLKLRDRGDEEMGMKTMLQLQ